MQKNFLKTIGVSLISVAIVISSSAMVFAETPDDTSSDSVTGVVDTVVPVDTEKIYNEWINYPNEKFGEGYNAGWQYNAEKDYINTTQNVGWTGFYNPSIDNFTTGIFSFTMKSLNFDPSGFTWGMKTGGTEEDPEYSFYAFETCHYSSKWCVARIDKWSPAKDGSSHQGPVYHSTIDASDDYYKHLGDSGAVGFATGEVLKFGDLDDSLYNAEYNVTINVGEKEVKIFINDELLTTVEADVIAGSFGPFATSNPEAFFSKLSFTTADVCVLEAKFEYQDESGTAVTTIPSNKKVTIKDLSSYDVSPIEKEIWTVKLGDEVIYTGETPYTEYNQIGEYVTTLQVANEQGIRSNVYSRTLTVTEPATEAPTQIVTDAPTATPTIAPTAAPTIAPTTAPTTPKSTDAPASSGKDSGTVATGSNSSAALFTVTGILVVAGVTTLLIAKKRKDETNV